MAARKNNTKTPAKVTDARENTDAMKIVMAEIERLKKANEDLSAQIKAKPRKSSEKPLSLKISTKGAVSLYGLHRFPAMG